MRKYPDLATIEAIEISTELKKHTGLTSVPGTVRVLPDNTYEAFFIARLRRTK